MVTWVLITEERYVEMLEVLPPALMTGYGFLVGEPTTHRQCTVKSRISPTYAACVVVEGRFYEASESLTVDEFCLFHASDVHRSFDVS